MLLDTSFQIVGDAGIKHGISAVGHYIDVVLLIHSYIITRDCHAFDSQ